MSQKAGGGPEVEVATEVPPREWETAMRTVTTEEELADAVKGGESEIEVQGDLAKRVHAARRRRKAARIGGGLLLVGGIAAAPFTGGLSLAASGASVGTICAVSAGAALLLAIREGYDADFQFGPGGMRLVLRRRGNGRTREGTPKR